ncbi:MAG: sporulation protein YqfD [Oscillospiraceae bacterium]|jgi:similar to stage IV sporulation protein|nr:sporulation protein YqfD [Oscillospiraceae bacterium]
MLKIVKYIFGFASFTITGKRLERFLNLAARSGINIWDIKKKSSDIFVCKVTAVDFKNLREFSRKSGVFLKLKSKHGLPFIINKLKRRPSLIAGPFCFYGVIYLLSLFVWNINIVGNFKLKEEEIIEAAAELGLAVGTPKGLIDAKIFEKNAMSKIKDLSWISVNLKGSSAFIELQEKKSAPERPKDKPCNIVAARSGQIVRVEVYSGNAEVKNGDAVAKGNLLVNGFVEDIFGKNTINRAEAKVFAITKHILREKLDFGQIEEFPTGKIINRRSVKFFGVKIPLTLAPKPKDNYQKEFSLNKLKIGESFLPITFYLERHVEYERKKILLTPDQTKEKIEERLKAREESEFRDMKILERSKKEKIQNGTCYADVTYVCEEDIAKKEEIIVNYHDSN